MKPTIPAMLRTMIRSLNEHVIPELDSDYARSQAGQISLTLEWMARGWVEPVQQVHDGNLAIRLALHGVSNVLTETKPADEGMNVLAGTLASALAELPGQSLKEQQKDRQRLETLLDDLVKTAGAPPGTTASDVKLWSALLVALECLAEQETAYGPIPLPAEHWER